jgi:hypothetical protein
MTSIGIQKFGDDFAWAVFSDENPDPTARDASGQYQCAYRYELGRVWSASRGVVAFCMMNPSNATHKDSDLTVTKCAGFAQRWGFGGILVVNLFAYRSTDPAKLLDPGIDPIGEFNTMAIRSVVRNYQLGRLASGEKMHGSTFSTREKVRIERIVAAWGTPPSLEPRFLTRMMEVEAMSPDWTCLGVTATGKPKHPSRIGYDSPLQTITVARHVQKDGR